MNKGNSEYCVGTYAEDSLCRGILRRALGPLCVVALELPLQRNQVGEGNRDAVYIEFYEHSRQ